MPPAPPNRHRRASPGRHRRPSTEDSAISELSSHSSASSDGRGYDGMFARREEVRHAAKWWLDGPRPAKGQPNVQRAVKKATSELHLAKGHAVAPARAKHYRDKGTASYRSTSDRFGCPAAHAMLGATENANTPLGAANPKAPCIGYYVRARPLECLCIAPRAHSPTHLPSCSPCHPLLPS